MIHQALHRSIPIELTADRRVRGRVKRLAAVSSVALGLIWVLAVTTLDTPVLVDAILVVGWVLMPVTLMASLRRPSIRYWLILPSSLVSLGLVGISVAWPSDDSVAAAGWMLMTVGVLLGGAMGAWFWFRLLPVPQFLDDPSASGRWALIALHIGLIVVGLGLVIAAGVG